MKNPKFKKVAVEAARLGDSKKAENIIIYELGKNSSLADYAVLMSADSPPQLEAAEEAVNKAFKEQGLFVLYREGGDSRAWKVLDYGGVLVHIFETRAREFYALDALYSSCVQIPWRETAPGGKGAAERKGASVKGKPVKGAKIRVKAAQKLKSRAAAKPKKKAAVIKKTKAKPTAKKKK